MCLYVTDVLFGGHCMHGYSKHNVINGTGAIAITRSVNSYMHKKLNRIEMKRYWTMLFRLRARWS